MCGMGGGGGVRMPLCVKVLQSSLSNPAPFATAFSAGLTRVLD